MELFKSLKGLLFPNYVNFSKFLEQFDMTFLFNHQTCCWRRKSHFFSFIWSFLNFYGKYHYHNVKDSSKEFSENHIFLWKALDMCVFMLEFSMFSISKLKTKIYDDRNFENMHYNFFLLCGLLFFSQDKCNIHDYICTYIG